MMPHTRKKISQCITVPGPALNTRGQCSSLKKPGQKDCQMHRRVELNVSAATCILPKTGSGRAPSSAEQEHPHFQELLGFTRHRLSLWSLQEGSVAIAAQLPAANGANTQQWALTPPECLARVWVLSPTWQGGTGSSDGNIL